MQNKNLFLIMFIFISTYAMDNKQDEKEPYYPSAAVEIDPLKESIEKHAYGDWKRKGDHLASYFTPVETPELVYDEWQIKKDAPFMGSHAYNIALSQRRAQRKEGDQSEKAQDADEKNDENKN